MDILVLLITDGKVQLNQNYNIKKRGELPAFHLILETLNPYLRDINNRQEREIALNIVTLLLNAGIDCKATDSEGRESSDFQLYTDIEKANESILKNKGIEKVRESISRKLKIAKLNNLQDLRSKKNLGTFATNSDFDEINNKISKLNEELLNVI